MRRLLRLTNHIRDQFELTSTDVAKPGDGGHTMTTESYAHQDGRTAKITYWDDMPAVVTRPGFEEVTEGS